MGKGQIKNLVFVFFCKLLTTTVAAQESSNSAGGNAMGFGGNIAYSIGQIFYTANSGNGGLVSQGVQHAYNIIMVSDVDIPSSVILTVYPNPADEYINLKLNGNYKEKLAFRLIDIQGKLLVTGDLHEGEARISTVNFPESAYYIILFDQLGAIVKSFKFIKTK